jgi:hypothetical protein
MQEAGAGGCLGAHHTQGPGFALTDVEEATVEAEEDAGMVHDRVSVPAHGDEEPAVAEEVQGDVDQGTGGEAEDPLGAFVAGISVQLQEAVLAFPAARPAQAASPQARMSARIAGRRINGASIEMLAREAVARRLGSLPPETSFSDRLMQAYLALFEGPLSDQAVAAIEDLVLAVKKKKNAPILDGGSVRPMPPVAV